MRAVLSQSGYLTALDANVVKTYFGANGNAYGVAYASAADPNGNPRPFQVSNQINLYKNYGNDPTLPSNAGVLTSSPAFPSGHAAFGYDNALILAQLVPEQYQQLVTRGAEYGTSRIVLGVHYPLDVIAGRIIAEKDVVGLLTNDPVYAGTNVTLTPTIKIPVAADFAGLVGQASTALRSSLTASCGTSIAACAAAGAPDRFSSQPANRAAYEQAMTYGLTPTGTVGAAAVVPTNAEALIATRYPYLTAAQRRDILASTELASGAPLDDGSGWARLDLYAAAGGFGVLSGTATIVQDAALGGLAAADTWNNDISGTGALVKQGTGQLTLAGTDTFSGGTTVAGGKLVAGSASALGTGPVTTTGGTLAVGPTTTVGALTLGTGSTLEFDLTTPTGGSLTASGPIKLGGTLLINLSGAPAPFSPEIIDISGLGLPTGGFDSIVVNGVVQPFVTRVVQSGTGVQISVQAVPEPASIAALLTALTTLAAARRREK